VTGVGLGLAIVDDCVIAMRGTITVDSTEGDGTTFCMTLPMTPVTVATPTDLLKPVSGGIGMLDQAR
jgi:signal transduction histidine kinase